MTLFWNRQVPTLAWVPPHLLRSLPPSFTPRLHAPSPSALPILSTQKRGAKGELAPTISGTPTCSHPPSRSRPTCMAAPFAPPSSHALPPLCANGCAGGTVRPPSPFCPGHPPLCRSSHSRGRPLCAPLITRPPRFRALS